MADNPRIEELRRRVLADPASIAFAALAEEYRRTGNYAGAIETCRVGLQRHPSYLSARVTLGRALMETAQYQEARRELEFVLKSAPENLAAIRGLAEIHEREGSLPEPDAIAPAPVARQPITSPSAAAVKAAATSVAQRPAADLGIAEWTLPPKAAEPVPVRPAIAIAAVPVKTAAVTAAPVIAAPVTPAAVIVASVRAAPVTAAPMIDVPVIAAPVIAAPVIAATPDPSLARLERFLVAIQSTRASSRISR